MDSSSSARQSSSGGQIPQLSSGLSADISNFSLSPEVDSFSDCSVSVNVLKPFICDLIADLSEDKKESWKVKYQDFIMLNSITSTSSSRATINRQFSSSFSYVNEDSIAKSLKKIHNQKDQKR